MSIKEKSKLVNHKKQYKKQKLIEARMDDEFQNCFAEFSNNPLTDEYLKILQNHYSHEGVEDIFKAKVKCIKCEVENLAKLIEQKRPELSYAQKLEVLDQLWDLHCESSKS